LSLIQERANLNRPALPAVGLVSWRTLLRSAVLSGFCSELTWECELT
jgi:hypothetical protein